MGEHSGRIGDDFIYDAGREEGSLGDDASSLQPSSYTSSHDPNEVDDFDNDVTDYHAGEDGTTADKAFADNLARSLSRDVRLWRTIVSLMLLITALLVTIGTYVVLTNEDTRQYQDAFESVAYQLGDAVQTKSWAIGNALESRAESLTSYMFDSVRTWPFATLSYFEVRGENTRRETQSSIFAWAPLLVTGGDKQEWNTNYSVQQGNIWLQESYARAIQTAGAESGVGQAYTAAAQAGGAIPDSVYRVDGDDLSGPTAESSLESWLPLWQISPPPLDPYPINFNLMSSPDIAQVVNYVADHQIPVVSDRFMRDPIIRHWVQQYDDITPEHDHVVDHDYDAATDHETHKHEGGSERRRLAHEEVNGYNENYENTAGHMFLVYPVFNTLDDGNGQNSNSSNTNASTRQMTGIFLELVRWDWILTDTLHTDTEEVLAVVKNTCGENDYAYKVNGMDATFWGVGDGDEERFGSDEIRSPVKHFGGVHVETSESCDFYLHVYPTKVFRESFDSDKATVFTVIVALAFGVTALFFLIYVRIVQRRQTKVMATAARTNAIVTSLFPSNVRDRIMKDAEEAANQNKELAPFLPGMGEAATKKLRTFLDTENPASNDNQLVMFKTKPIADLFPETTVMFGDLVGFTAWSSVREPTQVFQLLETIYHSFDEIARRRRVFKVETVGDCYVAVVGLPDPRKDHAVIMARFARDCLQTVNDLTKKLEVTLGPDTGDLQIRTGLHSGPVTAGVLRGEKSRFQLFGDTVNTAARMESTGSPSKIQLSSETADLLIAAGKTNWIREREEKVRAKGKGELQTYWLEVRHDGTASVTSGSSNSDLHDQDDLKMPQPSAKPVKDSPSVVRPLDAKAKRLVDWNCDQMIRLLKHVVARRNAQGRRSSAVPGSATDKQSAESRDSILQKKGTVLEEVREIIRLPNFDPNVYRNHDDPDAVQLSDDVLQQLHDYVSTIATLYRDNPFHNFEHASHVTMSVSKLLSRIVSPQDINNKSHEEEQKSEQKIEDYAWEVHKSTYGITSDPLTQFAVVFSALIHDVDHTGVPNATLVQENAKIAELYKQKSVAEQNSVDLAWDMLMDSKYSALQNVIYTNSSELERFRQLVVNSVMATDIVDKDLKGLRNARWDKAFKDVEEDEDTDVNRKATIVIEHLIQASDVAHTMQHWHIFRKWNERLFQEMHKAYREGRAEKDPSEFWFKGEIGFFDFYIIPLAKKLKECGVFGVSSDEYLNYAEKNREEWIVKGKEIVEQMLERVPKKSETPSQVPPETAP